MNSKIKKIISIFILIVIIVSSLTYYENSTEPKGLTFESGYYPQGNPWLGVFRLTAFQNFSFLGNTINVSYIMEPGHVDA